MFLIQSIPNSVVHSRQDEFMYFPLGEKISSCCRSLLQHRFVTQNSICSVEIRNAVQFRLWSVSCRNATDRTIGAQACMKTIRLLVLLATNKCNAVANCA